MMTDNYINKSLTIMHIVSGDLWAGAEIQLYYLAKSLNIMQNINLHIILLNEGILSDKLIANNISTYILDEKKISSLSLLCKVLKIAKKLKPDVVHTHRYKENILGGIITLILFRTKYVCTIHGSAEHKVSFNKIYKLIINLVNKVFLNYIADEIIFVSSDLQVYLKNDYKNNNQTVIENGIDIQETIQRSNEKYDISITDNRIKIIFIGRLVPVKRVDVFIKIAQKLIESNAGKYLFYIIGDGPLKEHCNDVVLKNNLKNDIILLGFLENPLPVLNNMDYLVITSDHEGLPLNLLEAMCLNVSIISNNIGGITKVLENGKCGYLVDKQDPNDYANMIIDNDKNLIEVKNKIELAFTNVKKHYSSEKCAEAYKKLYYSMYQ